MELSRRGNFFIEVPRDVDADSVIVLPLGMGSDRR